MLIAFRADASSQIGAGHIMRCLSLAQGLKEKGGNCLFITRDYPGNLIKHVREMKFTVEIIPSDADLLQDQKLTAEFCQQHLVDGIVTDSYQLSEGYLETLKIKTGFLISIDDLAQSRFPSDILLNQNLGVTEEDYQNKTALETKLLLGPRYLLLRPEFREKRQSIQDTAPVAKRVLVTMGGGDPHNQTLKVLKGLEGVSDLKIKAVTGAGYQYRDELKDFIECSESEVELIEDCRHMSELMIWADIAVSAGGATCWELACLGVPCLAITLAENQNVVVEELRIKGGLQSLGWYEDVTEENIRDSLEKLRPDHQKRYEMSERGKILVDGRGVERVVNEILLMHKV